MGTFLEGAGISEPTDVVSAVADVGGDLVHPLAVQHRQLLGERTGQLLIDGPGRVQTETRKEGVHVMYVTTAEDKQ